MNGLFAVGQFVPGINATCSRRGLKIIRRAWSPVARSSLDRSERQRSRPLPATALRRQAKPSQFWMPSSIRHFLGQRRGLAHALLEWLLSEQPRTPNDAQDVWVVALSGGVLMWASGSRSQAHKRGGVMGNNLT